MELLCPECMGTLAIVDGQTARCTTHGGEYRILFTRWQPPAATSVDAAALPPTLLAPEAVCTQHPAVAAVFACHECWKPMCAVCAFAGPDGHQLCVDCATRRAAAAPASDSGAAPLPIARALPPGVRCGQHPHLHATQQCQGCGAFLCATCAFVLPGNICLCPACATSPKTTLSSRRKKFLIGSFALAAWCTVAIAVLLSGAFAGAIKTKADEEAFGIIFSFVLLIPSLIGLALGVSARDRRLVNPPSIWIAIVWNALILGGFVLLCIIGLFS